MIGWFLSVSFAQVSMELPIDIELFRPDADPFGYVNTRSATTLEHLQGAFRLHFNQSDDPVVLIENGERLTGPAPGYADGIIDQRSRTDLQLGLGYRGRFFFSLTLPITVWQQGFEPPSPGPGSVVQEPLPSGLGDVRFASKALLLTQTDDRSIDMAIYTDVTAPSGSKRSFLGEGTPTASSGLIVEFSDAPVRSGDYVVRAAVNLGVKLKQKDTIRGSTFGSSVAYAAAIGIRPLRALEIGLEGVGQYGGPNPAQSPLEIRPHLQLHPQKIVSLIGGVGFGIRRGLGAPDHRFFLGFSLAPRFDPLALDRDGDGIPNKYDQCPSIPEDLDGYGDEDGCPETDNDGDGILDEVDRCPNEPEDLDGIADHDGCPDLDDDRDGIPEPMDQCPLVAEDLDGFEDLDGCPEADNDGDGILDLVDACPMVAEVFNGFRDQDGCPDQKVYLDSDADGLIDELDKCPTAPEDFDLFEDEDGCPELDNDNDGFLDPVDRCPLLPETMNGFEDQDGCPDEKPLVVVQAARLDIRDRVFFEPDRAVIRDVSLPLLDEIARVIQSHPDILRVRIEGHTDGIGGSYYNLRLSQARVRAVLQYLRKRGVAMQRLEMVGFGESRPLADNRTEEGRAINRRVEFVIVRSN